MRGFLRGVSVIVFFICFGDADNCCGRGFYSPDIYDDLISRRVNSSDAEKFAQLCPCPCNGVAWGVIWSVIIYNAFYLLTTFHLSLFYHLVCLSVDWWSQQTSESVRVQKYRGRVGLHGTFTWYLFVECMLFLSASIKCSYFKFIPEGYGGTTAITKSMFVSVRFKSASLFNDTQIRRGFKLNLSGYDVSLWWYMCRGFISFIFLLAAVYLGLVNLSS